MGPKGLRTNARAGDDGSGGEAPRLPHPMTQRRVNNIMHLVSLVLREGWRNCKASTP